MYAAHCSLQLPSPLDATVYAVVTAGKHFSLLLVDKQSGKVLRLLTIRRWGLYKQLTAHHLAAQ